MEKFIKNSEIFEAYLDGSLDSEKKNAVEGLLVSDTDYAKEFESFKLLYDGIKYSGRKKMLESIASWDQEMKMEGNAKSISFSPFKRYSIAASISFFLVLSSVLYFILIKDNLYDDYYTAFNYTSPVTRGADSETSTISQLYKSAKYQQVISEINNLTPEKQTDQLKLVLACSYMELEKFSDAIMILKKLSTSDGSYITASEWYLALCYLATDQPEHSKPLLKNISELNSSLSADAKKLLEELE